MSLAFNIANLVLGVLGSAGVLKAISALLQYYFPEQQLRRFDESYNSTTGFFHDVTREHLLPNRDQVTDIRGRLQRIHVEAEEHRAAAHREHGFIGGLMGLLRGLSRRISNLTTEAIEIRSEISASSERRLPPPQQESQATRASTVTAASRRALQSFNPLRRNTTVPRPASSEPFTEDTLTELVVSRQYNRSPEPIASTSSRPRVEQVRSQGVAARDDFTQVVSGVDVTHDSGLSSRAPRSTPIFTPTPRASTSNMSAASQPRISTPSVPQQGSTFQRFLSSVGSLRTSVPRLSEVFGSSRANQVSSSNPPIPLPVRRNRSPSTLGGSRATIPAGPSSSATLILPSVPRVPPSDISLAAPSESSASDVPTTTSAKGKERAKVYTPA